jgi:hypothetical protein
MAWGTILMWLELDRIHCDDRHGLATTLDLQTPKESAPWRSAGSNKEVSVATMVHSELPRAGPGNHHPHICVTLYEMDCWKFDDADVELLREDRYDSNSSNRAFIALVDELDIPRSDRRFVHPHILPIWRVCL